MPDPLAELENFSKQKYLTKQNLCGENKIVIEPKEVFGCGILNSSVIEFTVIILRNDRLIYTQRNESAIFDSKLKKAFETVAQRCGCI